MGETEVAAADFLLIGDEVSSPLIVAIDCPEVGATGESGEGDIDVVRAAPHQSDRLLGHCLDAGMAVHQVVI
jgi:hypothetical protein